VNVDPYRETPTALVATRQIAAPLRRRLFFWHHRTPGKFLFMGCYAAWAGWWLRRGWDVPACIPLAASVGYGMEIARRLRLHHREMRILGDGTLIVGKVLSCKRRWWRDRARLRLELDDGREVDFDALRPHEPGTTVRLAYEPGHAERALLLEDLPVPLRLDGDAWTPAIRPPSPPASLPPPPPRRP
jgi:hypothetical protein